LPDLRGRAALGVGQGGGLSDRRLGARGGAEDAFLNVAQLPAHTHAARLQARTTPADGRTPAAGVALGAAGAPIYTAAGGATVDLDGLVVGQTGGNLPVPLMQPWLAMNFIICTQGLFPSRN
jgi:microcystin-dependent protein